MKHHTNHKDTYPMWEVRKDIRILFDFSSLTNAM